jgi:hypothetical protein
MITHRLDLFENSVNSYNKQAVKIEETTEKEELKNELINIFHGLSRHSSVFALNRFLVLVAGLSL